MGEPSRSPGYERRPVWQLLLVAAVLCALYVGLSAYSFLARGRERPNDDRRTGAPGAQALPVLVGWAWFGPAGGVPCLIASTVLLVASGNGVWALALPAPAVAAWLLRRRERIVRHRLRVELDSAFEKQNALAKEKEVEEERAEGVRKMMSRFPPLREVGEKLLGVLSVEECAGILVSESLRIIDRADTALIYLVDEASGNLVIGAPPRSRLPGFRAESVAGDEADREVFLRGKPRLVERTADSGYRPKTRTRTIGSFMAAPLVVRERSRGVSRRRVAGVLRLDASEPGAFGRDELEVLGCVSDLGAQALSIARLHERTQELAIRDATTDLYVMSFFKERMNEELARSRRVGRAVSLLMLDIDHFKRFNDTWGHPAGDEVLKGIAEVVRSFARSGDIACRYGGEELALLLHEPKGKAADAAGRIREEVMRLRFGRAGEVVTVSIGVAGFPRDGDGVDELIAAADRALYAAKRRGRNRVCTA